jgi:ribosomal protein S3
LGILNSYKTFLQHQKYKSNAILKKNLFLEQFLEGLSLYTNKKNNVFLTFQNLNRGMTVLLSQVEQGFIKKRLLSLKRYSKEKFFKESLNVMLVVIKIKNSAKLFAQLIVQQFKFLKRHNYFLTFIKRIITLFISFKTSKVKGIKICISGRFNRAPRAKSRLIIVGDMPIQTISKQIDYHETTSYTKNGTFGIKLWVNYD